MVMTGAIEEVAGLLGIKPGKERPASAFDVIERIEGGLPVAVLDRVSRSIAPTDANFKYRIVSRATLDRRRKSEARRLSAEESERLARIAKLWAFARAVWGSDEEARDFLFRPHMLLEGRQPIEVAVKTEIGARLVEDILGRLEHGSAV